MVIIGNKFMKLDIFEYLYNQGERSELFLINHF